MRFTPSSSSISQHAAQRKHLYLVRWETPSSNFVKINFEGSLINNHVAIGFATRDWRGNIYKLEPPVRSNYILLIEATILHFGLSKAIEACYQKIQIECDNKIIIDAIKDNIQPLWQVYFLIKNITHHHGKCLQYYDCTHFSGS